MVIQLYGWDILTVSHHHTTSGGHKHCGSGDTMVLIGHVILQDHMIKMSWDFMGETPSR